MKIIRLPFAIAFLLSTLLSQSANAWNDRTHMIIAYMAYQRMKPEQRQSIADLLTEHPHYQSFLIKDRPETCPESLWLFMRAAVWPDYVNNDTYRAEFHRLKWHFVNYAYFPHEPPPAISSLEQGSFAPNILTALDDCYDISTDRYSSRARKAIAVAWLMHLLGDLHQPLHCVNLYSERFPSGDQGGNRVAIRDGDSPKKLHAYWDNILGEDKSLSSIEAYCRAQLTQEGPQDDTLDATLSNRDWSIWARESFRLAKEAVYLDGKLILTPWSNELQSSKNMDGVPVLDQQYQQTASRIAQLQVNLAARRLQSVMEDLKLENKAR